MYDSRDLFDFFGIVQQIHFTNFAIVKRNLLERFSNRVRADHTDGVMCFDLDNCNIITISSEPIDQNNAGHTCRCSADKCRSIPQKT